jgi:cell division protein ZapB
MSETETLKQLQDLSDRLDRLAQITKRLAEENLRLKQAQDQWNTERAQLVTKNELARTRVEAMISRLKSLENNQ